MLKEGDSIPAVTLPDQEGTEWAMRDLLGDKGAIFYFYPRDNTPGCTTEALDFQANLAAFETLGIRVVGVSKDSVKSHANFSAKRNLVFTLLSDKETELAQAFGVWQEKKNYGRSYMGVVRSTFVADGEGRIVKVYPKVKVKGHVEQVLADLAG